LGLSKKNSLIHDARGCYNDISTEISGKTCEKLLYCAVGVMEAGVRTPGSRLAHAAGNDPPRGGARVRGAPTDRSRMPHVVDDYFTAVQWRWLWNQALSACVCPCAVGGEVAEDGKQG
jgi:hypothetical protein